MDEGEERLSGVNSLSEPRDQSGFHSPAMPTHKPSLSVPLTLGAQPSPCPSLYDNRISCQRILERFVRGVNAILPGSYCSTSDPH